MSSVTNTNYDATKMLDGNPNTMGNTNLDNSVKDWIKIQPSPLLPLKELQLVVTNRRTNKRFAFLRLLNTTVLYSTNKKYDTFCGKIGEHDDEPQPGEIYWVTCEAFGYVNDITLIAKDNGTTLNIAELRLCGKSKGTCYFQLLDVQ